MTVKKERILAADDTPANLHLLGKILKQEGYDVRLVPKGALALSSAAAEPPDLILLDIKMPDMSGHDVCGRLKADPRTRNIPVIFISALHDAPDKVEAFSAGGVDYITKPFQAPEVLARVRTHLNLRSLQDRLERRNAELTNVNARLLDEIAERRRTETALRESEERFRTIVEHGADPILVYDETGDILTVNRAACQSLGYSREALLAMNVSAVAPDMARRSADADQAWPAMTETACIRRDGAEIPAEARLVPIRYDGKTAMAAFIRDIHARKIMEEERLRMKKLESLAVLTGGIAHDFNNMLFITLGNMDMIKNHPGLDAEGSKHLRRAEKAALLAAELVRELIVFSKGGNPMKTRASVRQLIGGLDVESRGAPPVRCDVRLSDDLWEVEADEVQMTQALNNLILNAREAMPDGGLIRLSARNVALARQTVMSGIVLDPGRYVEISIRDQGRGIAEAHLPLLFDPYFSTKVRGREKGSGLGLATAYAVIKRHDGRISAAANPDAGATFRIYLPAVDPRSDAAPEKDAPASAAKTQGARTGRILVMDDEQMIRGMLRKMLRGMGYEAETAAEGAEAVSLYKAAMAAGTPFDAVLLDLTVRDGMDGKETVKRLTAADPGVRAIISSGYHDDPVMADFASYGFCGAIAKPYLKEKLVDALTAVLEQ